MKTISRASKNAQPVDTPHKNEIDCLLIERIAIQRDPQAFTELFSKYSTSAYNLAFYLTGNRAQAEEAVQDAMLDIWQSASKFKPGTARNWILKIVARRSLKKFNRNMRIKTREVQQEESFFMGAPGFDKNAEEHELKAALYTELKALAPEDRQLIGLFYSGAYSQTEIAAAIKVPQSTVSFRLRKILDRLKANLTGSGYTSVVTAGLSNALIDAVLLTSQKPPVGWSSRMLSECRKHLKESNQPVKAMSVSIPLILFAIVGSLGFFAVIGTSWPLSKDTMGPLKIVEAGRSKTRAMEIQDRTRASTFVSTSKPTSFNLTWSFDKEAPGNLAAYIKSPKYWIDSAEKGANAMLRSADGIVYFYFPSQVTPQPFILTLKVRTLAHGTWGAHLYFMDKKEFVLVAKSWSYFIENIYKKNEARQQDTLNVYYTGAHMICALNGIVYSVKELGPVPPTASLLLLSKNWGFESINIRSVNVQDIPIIIDESEAFVKALNLKESIPIFPIETNRNKIQ